MNSQLLVSYVEDYLNDARSLQELQELLIDVAWSGDTQTADVLELASGLELKIAEYTGGYIPEDALKAALSDIANLAPSVMIPAESLRPPADDLTWESRHEEIAELV